MKTCHITTVHKPFDNRIFFKECVTLQQCGYEVVLLCANAATITRDGVRIIGFRGYNGRILRMIFTSFFTVLRIALRENADAYHLHDPELIWSGIVLRLIGKKVIMDLHENNAAAILSRPYIRFEWFARILSHVVKVVEKITLPLFNGIVTARPDISALYPNLNPVTLRNFPVLPDFDTISSLEMSKNKRVIIYVGGATRIRGTLELVSAMEKVTNAELWILGPFESEEFKKECEVIPGWKYVKHLGVVEADEIFPYIKAADVGIITFLPKPNHVTTLATKPFEYMACGLPVIMSNFKYWMDFFGDSALYVDPENSNAIALAIDSLFKDNDRLVYMRTKNLRLAREEFNWQKEKEKLIKLYERILGAPKASIQS